MKKIIYSIGLIFLGSVATLSIVYARSTRKRFPDVRRSAYYYDAVREMNSRGIIKGYQNGKFGPNDPVTRAQLMTILKRYDDRQINSERKGGVGKLQTLLCASLKKEDLNPKNMGWGYPLEIYDEVCPSS